MQRGGETLDLVVDYTTYVFVPAYAVVAGGLMPDAWAIAAAAVIAARGALYFAKGEMKTADNFFRVFPAVWNLVILALLILLRGQFHGENQIYAYAIAWLAATLVQFLMVASALGRIDFRLQFSVDWHDPRVRQVFVLMLPVTISLGVINFDNVINSIFGTLVSKQAPAAIDRAFRIYMLPQGIFSVAVATVLFPTLSRFANVRDLGGMRRAVGVGMRQINLLLIPSAALMIAGEGAACCA